MKIVTIKGVWLLHWRTNFYIDISSRLWVIGVSNVENRTHTHTRTHAHTHTHTSERQLKITFLDVLDYSEYSDTNISKKKISRKHSFLSEEAKKIFERSFDKKNFGKINSKTKIFIIKLYSNIDKCHAMFALLALFDKTGRKTGSNKIVCGIWCKIVRVPRKQSLPNFPFNDWFRHSACKPIKIDATRREYSSFFKLKYTK